MMISQILECTHAHARVLRSRAPRVRAFVVVRRVLVGVAAALSLAACGLPSVNPDFNQYIIDNLKKNQDINFASVGLSVVTPPYKTAYEIGESWLPVKPDNPDTGIKIGLVRGGGSQVLCNYQNWNEDTKKLTMQAEDGTIIDIQVGGFDTTTLGHNKPLTLALLDNDGVPRTVPILDSSYQVTFEGEGQDIALAGNEANKKLRALLYSVYQAGGTSGKIDLTPYEGAYEVWTPDVIKTDLNVVVRGTIAPIPGYKLTALRYVCPAVRTEIPMADIDTAHIDYSNTAYPAGLISFTFKITETEILAAAEPYVTFEADFERAAYHIIPNFLPTTFTNGSINQITVNGRPASETNFTAFSGDRIVVTTAAWPNYILSTDGVSYTTSPTNVTTSVPNNATQSAFYMPFFDIDISAAFESALILFVTVDGTQAPGASKPTKLTYNLGDYFDPTGIKVIAVQNDRTQPNVDVTSSGLSYQLNNEASMSAPITVGPGGIQLFELGTQTIIVKVQGKSTQFTITVTDGSGSAVALRTVNGKNLFYPTLTQALEAAPAGTPDTITILQDISVKQTAGAGVEAAPFVIGNSKNITLRAYGNKTIKVAQNFSSLTSSGVLFSVPFGAALTLGDAGGTLALDGGAVWTGGAVGHTDSPAHGATNSGFSTQNPLVYIGGSLTLRAGAVLRNNDNLAGSGNGIGGGVRLIGGASLTMHGGDITGNKATSGGGIYTSLYTGTNTLNITGGRIAKNYAVDGGGIFAYHFVTGSFTVGGDAAITNNYAERGGGVYFYGSAFTLNGGSISGNMASISTSGAGAGIFLDTAAQFAQTGGVISGNFFTNDFITSSSSGGQGRGVFADDNINSFKMSGAAVIAKNNEVYLEASSTTAGSKITITAPLSAATAAYIVPGPSSNYYNSRVVLDFSGMSVADQAVAAGQMALANLLYTTTYPSNATGQPYFIMRGESGAVGTIGSAIAGRSVRGETRYYQTVSTALDESALTDTIALYGAPNLSADTVSTITIAGGKNITLKKGGTSGINWGLNFAGKIVVDNAALTLGGADGITGIYVYSGDPATNPIMRVQNGGHVILNTGSGISALLGSASPQNRPILSVGNASTFTMNGGFIYGFDGGTTDKKAVSIEAGAVFEMNGGMVGYDSRNSSNDYRYANVYCEGTFKLQGNVYVGDSDYNNYLFLTGASSQVQITGALGNSVIALAVDSTKTPTTLGVDYTGQTQRLVTGTGVAPNDTTNLTATNLGRFTVTALPTPPSADLPVPTGYTAWPWKLAGTTGYNSGVSTLDYGKLWIGNVVSSNAVTIPGAENVKFTFNFGSLPTNTIRHGSAITVSVSTTSGPAINTTPANFTVTAQQQGGISPVDIPCTDNPAGSLTSRIVSADLSSASLSIPGIIELTVTYTNAIATYSKTLLLNAAPAP